ncbi:hypothetical protein IGI04_030368 [Brassica rapa subsp. trilocularis]|uniref:Uncharacterized protein n=1 Tax=Brassica rapa subsp. trilocularis TaxID=1813537 RepID=A0ABQ7LRB5_BRACM|nr:hypothetical protein IGI04_030368 [Brassica rapa subsp. trilocularis]
MKQIRKKNQRREVSLHDPFSPSYDFYHCVLLWLRAEEIEITSRIMPCPHSILGSYQQVMNYKSCEALLYTHSPESSRITVNCSCDTEQGHEDTMMGSHPRGRITACSIRCSILEYLMEMMVIFISPLGSVSLGGFPDLLTENLEILLFLVEKPGVIFNRSVGVLWLLV